MAWIGRLAGSAVALALFLSMIAGGAQADGPRDAPSAPRPAPKTWLPWIEGGGFLSTERHRGEVNLFAPIWQSSVALLFFQGTGKVFEDDIEEGNFALGFRRMHRSGWNLGLWAGHDIRNSELDNTFHQLAFGFEMLSDRWDLRANGYVTLSDPEASPGIAQAFLSGNTIFMTGGREVPLSGFDGEVGYKLFGTSGSSRDGGPAARGRSHELRVFAGGFYFDDHEALEEVAGPRARIEWRIDDVVRWLPGSRLTFEGEFQYDEVRDDQWEGGVRFRVPFGGGGQDTRATVLASLTPQERRMTESIVRDTDIVTGASEEEAVSDYLTGTAFETVTVVDNAGDLQQRIDDVGGDSLIVVKGDTHQGPIVLGPDQTLQGGGSTIRVKGAESGVVAEFTAPGSRPFIEFVQNQAILTVDRNTHVAGIGIRGAGAASGLVFNAGIAPTADGVSNVAISDTMIMDMGGVGIEFYDNHNTVVIYDTSVRNTRNMGIHFGSFNSNVTVNNVSIANAGTQGIFFWNNNSNVSIENVTIRNVDNQGISFNDTNNDVTIARAIIANAGRDGIEFQYFNSNVLITHTTIATVDLSGIFFWDNNANVTISNTSLADVAETGIHFLDDNSNVTVSGNTLSNVAGNGILLGGGSSATITGNTLTDIVEDAIDVGDNLAGSNTLTITNNTFAGTIGGDAVQFDGVVDTLLDGSGNRLAPGADVRGSVCELRGVAGFVGTLEIDGVTFVDGTGCT